MKIHLANIPVYRLDPESYETELSCLARQYTSEYCSEETAKEELFRIYGSWKFNEIIGYIDLHIIGSQIRGEYWSSIKKRIIRTRKKVITWRTWKIADEINIIDMNSNAAIAKSIIEYLHECSEQLSGLYIDDNSFKDLLPFIDLSALIKSKTSSIQD
jgi:hypothetical protein